MNGPIESELTQLSHRKLITLLTEKVGNRQGWSDVAEELLDRCEAGAQSREQLEEKLKERDKCSFMGPMRDCPTHGESTELRALKERTRVLAEALEKIKQEVEKLAFMSAVVPLPETIVKSLENIREAALAAAKEK